jgi:hypothetical protein
MEWGAFWAIMIALFVFIPLLMLWVFALVDLFGRHDLGGFAKVLWLLAIIFLPILGVLVYFVARPTDPFYGQPESSSVSERERSSR